MLGDCGRVTGSALQYLAKLQKRVIFIRALKGSRSLTGRDEKRRVGKGKEDKRGKVKEKEYCISQSSQEKITISVILT